MDMDTLFLKYGLDTASNVGRRNSFLSWVHEHLVASSIGVKADGRSGHPDMVVGGHPLECRIASPRSACCLSLWATVPQVRKYEVCDYVYIIASRDMLSFALLHIKDVTAADFKPPTRVHGNKLYMIRSAIRDRVVCLHGDVRTTPLGFRIITQPL
jgi:hypothetical protein